MKLYRLYTGPDQQSHLEKLEDTATRQWLDTVHPVTGLLFRTEARPHILKWHNAPRRQWVVTLAGSVEIGLGDGSWMTFGPGDVFLAEDLTGQGHTAKPTDWVRAFIHIE